MFNIGDKVVLDYMADDPDPIPPGTRGTITFVNRTDSFIQYGVEWENGRTLMACCPPDVLALTS